MQIDSFQCFKGEKRAFEIICRDSLRANLNGGLAESCDIPLSSSASPAAARFGRQDLGAGNDWRLTESQSIARLVLQRWPTTAWVGFQSYLGTCGGDPGRKRLPLTFVDAAGRE